MKIAILSSGFLPIIDGITIAQMNRLQKLSESGHQILLFCPDYRELEPLYPNWKDYTGMILPGVRVVNLESTPFLGLKFERSVTEKSYQNLLTELEKFQPDLIHLDEPERLELGFGRIPAVDFAKHYSIPCISFYHTHLIDYLEDYVPLPSLILKPVQAILKHRLSRLYNAYDLTLTASTVTRDYLSQIGVRNVRAANLLGFDRDRFSPHLRENNFFANHYQIANLDRRVKLLFLGRLTPDKGWKFTIRSFCEFATHLDFENLALIIGGDGPLRSQIATQLRQLTPNVYLLGTIPPDRVPALLANSDIHVTTSEKETKGLTVLEAFASGIPVVAPRAGGLIDSIRDGWNGSLYEPGNAADFIYKLTHLIQNSKQRQTMGINARNDVAELTWETATQNLLTIWQEQIERIAT